MMRLGKTLGEALLAPTRIYVKALRSVKEAGVRIKGCSHITGGGFYENIPRMLPDGVKAVVKKDSYKIPAIFRMLAKEGSIEEQMMYNTFNMGIGMVLAVDPADVDATLAALAKHRGSGMADRRSNRRRKGSRVMLRLAVLVSGGGTNSAGDSRCDHSRKCHKCRGCQGHQQQPEGVCTGAGCCCGDPDGLRDTQGASGCGGF